MTRKPIIIAVVGIMFLGGVFLFQKYLPAIRAPFFPAPGDITEYIPDDSIPPGSVNETNLPLKLPAGFSISIFAKNLPGARVMAFDSFGNMWVSRTSEGAVTLLEIGEDGKVQNQNDIFTGLRKPHGLAFDPEHPGLLYIAEENKIRRVATYSDDPGEDVLTLPSGGGHFTRTIGFGPDNKLYISVGSSCNVCHESDERRATILQHDTATQKFTTFARGLRNSVFFIWDTAGKMWATEMGRDLLGDDTPPDEINIISGPSTGLGAGPSTGSTGSPQAGSEQNSIPNFGWPNCYGKNIHDSDFDKNTYIRNPCMEPFEMPSTIDIPAHSAPLGLAFVPANSKWPKEYWGNLLIAYHGSWNRTQPTGYKVVRYAFNEQGTVNSEQDFITGWLTPDGALGRPVDISVKSDGTMYLSDDKAGVIYKITAS